MVPSFGRPRPAQQVRRPGARADVTPLILHTESVRSAGDLHLAVSTCQPETPQIAIDLQWTPRGRRGPGARRPGCPVRPPPPPLRPGARQRISGPSALGLGLCLPPFRSRAGRSRLPRLTAVPDPAAAAAARLRLTESEA
jgi:hypothetical protein